MATIVMMTNRMNYPEKVVNSTTNMVIYQQIAGSDACKGLDNEYDETV